MLSVQARCRYLLSASLSVQLARLQSSSETQDSILKNRFQEYLDTLSYASVQTFLFAPPGKILADYSRRSESYTGFSISTEIKHGIHRFEIGAGADLRTLRKFVPGPQYASTLSSYGIPFGSDDSQNQRILRNLLLFEAYGFDVFGRKIDSDTGENEGPIQPSRYALYLNHS